MHYFVSQLQGLPPRERVHSLGEPLENSSFATVEEYGPKPSREGQKKAPGENLFVAGGTLYPLEIRLERV